MRAVRRPAPLHGLEQADPHRLRRLPGLVSLGEMRKISEEGVKFASPVNGDKLFLTPEISMQIQTRAELATSSMLFDECTPYDTNGHARPRPRRAIRWSCRCAGRSAAQTEFDAAGEPERAVRHRAGRHVRAPARGVAGGAGRDRTSTATRSAASASASPRTRCCASWRTRRTALPADKPRYLMGVGTPEDLVEGVAHGVDMFDCVMPTRNARNGHLFTRFGDLKIRNAQHRSRRRAPLDETCACYTLRANFTPRLPAPPDRCGEMLGADAHHHPQPALLPEPDARDARRARRRPVRRVRAAFKTTARAGRLRRDRQPVSGQRQRHLAAAAPRAAPPPAARRLPNVQPHAAEQAAPERPHHRPALLDAAEERAPQVGQRHRHHRQPAARAPRIFMMPPLNGCSVPSRVMPPSGKIASRSPSRSTCAAASKAAS